MARKLKSTVTIKVTDCGCGNNGRPRLYGSFEIPDTGDAAINVRIAYRIMESKYGKQYECRAHDTSDYHWAFGPEPVGKWTGNEIDNDGPVKGAKVRIAEISRLLQEPESMLRAQERTDLDAERSALEAWLVRIGEGPARKFSWRALLRFTWLTASAAISGADRSK